MTMPFLTWQYDNDTDDDHDDDNDADDADDKAAAYGHSLMYWPKFGMTKHNTRRHSCSDKRRLLLMNRTMNDNAHGYECSTACSQRV